MTYSVLTTTLRAEGGYPGIPKGDLASVIDAIVIDREIAADMLCDECGHIGFTYTPWTDPTGLYLAAVATCEGCGETVEF